MKRRSPRAGFTLIEILVVSLIVVVVAAIVLVLYQTVNGVRSAQGNITQGSSALGQALRLLSRDLACSYLTDQEGTAWLMTEAVPDDRVSSSLQFAATLRDVAEDDYAWNTVQTLQYYVDDRNFEEPTLLRVSRPLVGIDSMRPAITNELVRNVKAFTLEAYDGKDWQPEWSSADAEGLPQAVKLSIEMLSDNVSTQRVTKVYIAAGNGIKK